MTSPKQNNIVLDDKIHTSFPLYDTLMAGLPKNEEIKDLTLEQKYEFIRFYKKLDKNGKDLFFVLIRMFFIKNEKINETNDLFTIPYGGELLNSKTDNNGQGTIGDAKFNLENLPLKLKRILYNFLERDNELKKNNK